MLADVGMVKTYSKSAHVNDLGFVWSGPPCCMDQLPPPPPPPPRPLCMDRPSSLLIRFFRQVVLPYLAGTHCTIPTSALVFGGNIFTHPLAIVLLYKQHSWSHHQEHKGGSLSVCQLVGNRLVMPLLLRPQLVMHWLVMHALAKDSPGWPGDVSVSDHVCMQYTWKITVDKQQIAVRS